MKHPRIRLVIILSVIILGSFWLRPSHTAAPGPNTQTSNQSNPSASNPDTTKPADFDRTKYSLTDPNSLWVIANKSHPLQPKSYVPTDLVLPNVPQRIPGAQQMEMRAPAAKALESMFADAKSAGYSLLISTAYRSYSYQKSLYDSYATKDGVAKADTYSARPGTSEHQTGLALDIRDSSGKCSLQQCFGDLPSAQWLAANSYKYGFILRYTKDKVAITGYEYEPWHFRYVGTVLSNEMHQKRITTLEEFFNVKGGTSYN